MWLSLYNVCSLFSNHISVTVGVVRVYVWGCVEAYENRTKMRASAEATRSSSCQFSSLTPQLYGFFNRQRITVLAVCLNGYDKQILVCGSNFLWLHSSSYKLIILLINLPIILINN